jgi:hypothetical protein
MSSSRKLTQLHLKAVIRCSFQRSEVTNLDLFRQEGHFPGELLNGEAFLLLAKGGNQLIFIFRSPVNYESPTGASWEVIDSRKLRLTGGTWSPYMLQDYANEVGLNLVGIKRFEQVHDEMQAAKRGKQGG